ncbi:MAG: 3'-5' exonuclease domain-containing protein 2 [Bacteroidales bacterium]|nr:3'-5' exonuclease domain-containing protein 2 [Bacteroidales bacterium]MBN2699513.1 3'-5' exonuclease domain-containing protein 2 [Bacteroidales bacterium]
MFLQKISREEIDRLEIRSFDGRVHLIDSPGKFQRAYPSIKAESILGFDTETRPSFRKGTVHDISLIQLASASEAWLLRINRIGIPPELKNLFEDAGIMKVGVGLKDDLRKIKNLDTIVPAGFLDLQKFVEQFEIESRSLKKITAIILGFKISKSQQLSNWNADELTEAQKLYAATDAWVCYLIYKKLTKVQHGSGQGAY